jgi:hypothetical protein
MGKLLISMNKGAYGILMIVSLLCLQRNGIGQEVIKIKRITSTVEFDGIPGEAAWQTLDRFALTMHKPNYGIEPSEKNDIRIGYDNEFLWVGASLYMKDASKIFAVTKKRDEELFDYDAFGIILDTYNDNENGLAFFTTPTGLRTDYTISNDASGQGGGPGGPPGMNYSWNTFWDVKTTRDDKGWYVEMRIPFSSLKFKSENDIATMGMIISRNISANNETDTYPAIDPKYGFMATNKPSQAQTAEIEGAKPTKPLYISPYVLGGFSRDWSLNEEGTEYIKEDNPQYNSGIDVKYNINSNLTLDLTANTDFAQVEADDYQVNLTRYSLFFPEKRMFFQERSSLFDFSLGGGEDNLFYSRNIGIADGEPIRIYGGARLTGRLGKWDMGFLDMQTAEHKETPGENFGVLRMRRQVINQNSYVGGILTSRLGMNGNQNFSYGVDGIFRLFGDDYLNVKWSQTYDSKIDNKLNSLDPSFILVDWTRRSEEGFAYNFNYTYAGQEFNPGIGFVRRKGVQGLNGQLLYGWIPGEKSKLFSHNINIRGERYTRLEDGKLESMQISPGFEIKTKKGIRSEFSLEYQEEGVLNDFQLSDSIIIHAGNYSFTGMQTELGTSDARMISLRADVNAGQFYDGNRIGFEAESNFNLSSSLKLSAGYEFNAIRFPERETNNSLNIHSLNMKALYMFSTKLSATLFVQYVNTEDELITNFRLRYNPREGNDLFLVYNDFRGITDSYSIQEHPKFFNKTIMVKYTHTFIL